MRSRSHNQCMDLGSELTLCTTWGTPATLPGECLHHEAHVLGAVQLVQPLRAIKDADPVRNM